MTQRCTYPRTGHPHPRGARLRSGHPALHSYWSMACPARPIGAPHISPRRWTQPRGSIWLPALGTIDLNYIWVLQFFLKKEKKYFSMAGCRSLSQIPSPFPKIDSCRIDKCRKASKSVWGLCSAPTPYRLNLRSAHCGGGNGSKGMPPLR
jgi:hypothetical protein